MGQKVTIELTDAQWEQLSQARLERMDREKRYIEPAEMVQAVFLEGLGGGSPKPGRPAPAAKAPAPKEAPAEQVTVDREQGTGAVESGRAEGKRGRETEDAGKVTGNRLQGTAKSRSVAIPRPSKRTAAAAAPKRTNGNGATARLRRTKSDPDEPVVSDEEVVKGLPEGHRYLRAIPGEAPQKGRTSLEERVRRYRYWLQHPQGD